MILTTPSLERGTSTEYYTPCSDFPDFNDEWAGSRATSATYNLGTSVAWGGDGRGLGKTSSATYSYSDGTCTGVTVTTSFEDYSVYWFSIFMAFFQYFIVSFLYIGLLDLCDALRCELNACTALSLSLPWYEPASDHHTTLHQRLLWKRAAFYRHGREGQL